MLRLVEAESAADILKRIEVMDAQAAQRAIDILRELHTRVLAEIAAHPDLTAYTLPGLKARIEELMRTYQQQITVDLHNKQADIFNLSDDVIDAMARAAGLSVGIVGISDTILRIAQAHSASEITGVSNAQLQRINRELSQAVLGGRTFPELLQNIGTNLDGPSVFGTMATRVETIVRTESANVFNWGFQSRGNQVAEQLPGMRKRWVHRHGMAGLAIVKGAAGKKGVYQPRPAHLALDGVSIPWADEFNVNGWKAIWSARSEVAGG